MMARIILFLLAAALTLSFPPVSLADVLEVRADGTGEYPNIRAAVFAAQSGDTVLLADGNYLGPDNHNVSFLGKSILLCSESDDPNLCIIDCQGPGPIERGFIFNSGEQAGSVLRGVGIVNATNAGGVGVGAGVVCQNGSSPSIQNCRIANSLSQVGAAVAVGSGTSPVFTDCEFLNNYATESAGGVSVGENATPHFLRCEFRGNGSPSFGGAVETWIGSSATLEECLFVDNYSDVGGCVWVWGGSPVFVRCQFYSNEATTQGAVLQNESRGFTEFQQCTFHSNTARHGGVAYISLGGDVRFSGCTMVDNSGSFDGGVASCHGDAHFSGCTMVGNSGSFAIVIAWGPGEVVVDHTIIAFSVDGSPIECYEGNPSVSCSDFYGNPDGDWVGCIADEFDGITNVSIDPLFCNLDAGDLHLDPDSWCAPGNNPGCGLVGAWEVGCTTDVPDGSPQASAPLIVTPNPAMETCRIAWRSVEGAGATITIYDLLGRSIRSVRDVPAGPPSFVWDRRDDRGRRVPSGIYLVRVRTGTQALSARVVLD